MNVVGASVRRFHDFVQYVWRLECCPVCFIKLHLHCRRTFMCMECGCSDCLWYCLHCGYVGCNKAGHNHHGREHFLERSHNYFARLEDLKVWDYQMSILSHDGQIADQEFDQFSMNVPSNFYTKCFCSVCLYNKTPRLLKFLTCMHCNIRKSKGLWICKTCGHVGCGRLQNGHAMKHYEKTGHNLATQLADFTTWDYKENEFVTLNEHIPELPLNESDNSESNGRASNSEVSVRTSSVSAPVQSIYLSQYAHLYEFLVRRVEKLEQNLAEASYPEPTSRQMRDIEFDIRRLKSGHLNFEQQLYEHEEKLRNLELQIANITSRQAAEDRNRRSFGSFFKNNLTLSIVGAGAALIYFIFKDLS